MTRSRNGRRGILKVKGRSRRGRQVSYEIFAVLTAGQSPAALMGSSGSQPDGEIERISVAS